MDPRHRIDPALLGQVSLFAGLDGDALRDVLDWADWRRVKADEAVFRQADPAETVYVLAVGHVKVDQVTPEGQHVVIRFINPWEMMGCLAVCGGGDYPGTALAVEDSAVLAWRRDTLETLMDRHPRIARNALSTVAGRLRDTQHRLRELSTERVERRIAHALTRLADASGRRADGGGIEISFPISRKDLAELSGTTLHTVSRTLSAWEDDGIVENARRRVIVRRPEDLVAIADAPDAADAG